MRTLAVAALVALAALAAAAPPLSDAECRGDTCEEEEEEEEEEEAGLLQTGSRGLAGLGGVGAKLGAANRTVDDEKAIAALEAAFPQQSSAKANAVLHFAPDKIEQALVMGTDANIGTSVPNFSSVMDMTGIWYIKWASQGDPALIAYKKARMEIAVTFADATVSGYTDPNSPFTLSLFGQKAQHWAYSDSLLAQGQMFAHATQWDYCHPLGFEMKNSREGVIGGIGPFTYINADQWERPTDTAVGTFTYKLSRIVYANGTKTKHYQHYATLMRGYQLAVWGNDDQMARCLATAPFSFLCYTFHDLGSCAA